MYRILIVYNYPAHSSDDYFHLNHTFESCVLTGVCTSPLNLSIYCIINYTTFPELTTENGILHVNASNEESYDLTQLGYSEVYQYFARVRINETFEVINSGNFSLGRYLVKDYHLHCNDFYFNYAVPAFPEIIKIVARYPNRGKLKLLRISWVNLAKSCKEFGNRSVYYTLSVRDMEDDSEATSSIHLNSEECVINCTVRVILTPELLAAVSLKIVLEATNGAETSKNEHNNEICKSGIS